MDKIIPAFETTLFDSTLNQAENATDFMSLLAYSHPDFVYTKLSPEGIKKGQF